MSLEFAGTIYRHCLRDVFRKKRPEKWRTNNLYTCITGGGSWFLLHDNAPAHQSVLVKDFLAMICDNTGPSPTFSWPGSSRFLPVPSGEISTEGTVLLWWWRHHEDCDRGAKKAFQKLLPGMFPTPLQLLTEVYSSKRCPTILKEMWLKLLYWLVLLRNKMIPRTFWNYHSHAYCLLQVTLMVTRTDRQHTGDLQNTQLTCCNYSLGLPTGTDKIMHLTQHFHAFLLEIIELLVQCQMWL
jgi:hypothetical protein